MIFKHFRRFQSFKSALKNRPKTIPPIFRFKMKGEVRSSRLHMIEHKDRGEVLPRIWADFLNFIWFFSSFLKSSFFGFLFDFFNKKIFFLTRAFRTRRDLQVFFIGKNWTYFLRSKKLIKIAFLLEEKVSVSICNFLGSYAAFANIPD